MKPLSVLPPDLSAVLGAFHRLECVYHARCSSNAWRVPRGRCLPSSRLAVGQIEQTDQGWVLMENREGCVVVHAAETFDLAGSPVINQLCCDCKPGRKNERGQRKLERPKPAVFEHNVPQLIVS